MRSLCLEILIPQLLEASGRGREPRRLIFHRYSFRSRISWREDGLSWPLIALIPGPGLKDTWTLSALIKAAVTYTRYMYRYEILYGFTQASPHFCQEHPAFRSVVSTRIPTSIHLEETDFVCCVWRGTCVLRMYIEVLRRSLLLRSREEKWLV